CDRLLAGIDQVPVFLALWRGLTEIEHAVFGVEHRLPPRRLELGHHFGKADAQIDIGAIGDVLRRAPGDLRIGKFFSHRKPPRRASGPLPAAPRLLPPRWRSKSPAATPTRRR